MVGSLTLHQNNCTISYVDILNNRLMEAKEFNISDSSLTLVQSYGARCFMLLDLVRYSEISTLFFLKIRARSGIFGLLVALDSSRKFVSQWSSECHLFPLLLIAPCSNAQVWMRRWDKGKQQEERRKYGLQKSVSEQQTSKYFKSLGRRDKH